MSKAWIVFGLRVIIRLLCCLLCTAWRHAVTTLKITHRDKNLPTRDGKVVKLVEIDEIRNNQSNNNVQCVLDHYLSCASKKVGWSRNGIEKFFQIIVDKDFLSFSWSLLNTASSSWVSSLGNHVWYYYHYALDNCCMGCSVTELRAKIIYNFVGS